MISGPRFSLRPTGLTTNLSVRGIQFRANQLNTLNIFNLLIMIPNESKHIIQPRTAINVTLFLVEVEIWISDDIGVDVRVVRNTT